jgi:predicted anti-sigma-YlaC factor YlaD
MMTCKEVLEALSSLIDDDVRNEVAEEIKKHIGHCSDCRAEFDTLTMTIKLYRHNPQPAMPAECHDRLVKVLEIEKLRGRTGTNPSSSS